jgi:hypothetical protein
MGVELVLAILAVAAAWILFGYSLWRWGPGRSRRMVRCPKWGTRAELDVEVKEKEFGSVQAVDVVSCSLFPDRAVNCEKECLRQL